MFLRLAFAISTSIDPDILIMDEMIAAGDSQFIEKAKRRLNQIIDRAHILVLASHDMRLIQNICNKVVWLDWIEQNEKRKITRQYQVGKYYADGYDQDKHNL